MKTDTCPRCYVPLVSGQVLAPTMVSSRDFPGDTGVERGCTMTPGPSIVVPALKCPKCGFSRAVVMP